jgi:hypothetical protein
VNNFFREHWLGIFLSSVLAGIVGSFIYDHWSNQALIAALERRFQVQGRAGESIQSATPDNSQSSIAEPGATNRSTRQPEVPSAFPPAAETNATASEAAPAGLGVQEGSRDSVPDGLAPGPVGEARPSTSTPELLSAPQMIERLSGAGFQGSAGDSQWPQWRLTTAAEHEYTLVSPSHPRVVSDRRTGLDWYVDEEVSYVSWDAAERFVARLNRERPLGMAGWRLPTLEELVSILEAGDKDCLDQRLRPSPVPSRGGYGNFWSSDRKSENWVWTLDTYSPCGIHKWGKEYGSNILAVRLN